MAMIMNVLIKGASMDKKHLQHLVCGNCPYLFLPSKKCQHEGGKKTTDINKRPTWCPIDEIKK